MPQVTLYTDENRAYARQAFELAVEVVEATGVAVAVNSYHGRCIGEVYPDPPRPAPRASQEVVTKED
jgi:N-formylglutamate amidohydrolase